ncbi:MAG: acyloxyacyl hydrolase [Nitrospiraceae bacterium]
MGLSGASPIGEQTQKDFQQYDVAATWALPWGWYSESGWGIGTRLLVSAGALTAAKETSFLGTIVPGIAFGRKDGRFSIDLGAGVAFLPDYKFGNQNFGGPLQFVWHLGASLAVYKAIGVGYHFQHYSDATIYGTDSRGVDLHMIEVSYRF